MSNFVTGTTNPPSNGMPSSSYAQNSAGPVVNYHGERVSLIPAQSLMASAAEEASFKGAEKKSMDKDKDKDLNKRKIGDRPPINTHAMEQARSYLEIARDLDKEKQLKPFLGQLLTQSEASSKQLRQLTGQHFKDISQQYLALVFSRDQLRQLRTSGTTKALDTLLESVDTALDEMMNEHGAAISAGINISSVASDYSGSQLGTQNQLRQFYRDAVLDHGSLSDTFQKILAQYGDDHFSSSVAFLVRALGADLAAEGPSLPKERLRMIVEDLYKLQSLGSLDDECSELLSQLQRTYREHTLPTKLELMGQLLKLLDNRWISADTLKTLTHELKIPDEIRFLTGFKELVRLIPLKIYKDPYERETRIDAIQERLNQLIELEEDGMEQQS